MNDNASECDLIVVGAGIYGIQVARTYLELHPARSVAILEASDSVGGVWSNERVYDDFWTQTPIGLLEFSDRPLQPIPDEDHYYGFFRAHHVASYLEAYCESHVYNGASLRARVRTGDPVTKIRKLDRTWHVDTSRGQSYRASHLVDASGLTSNPKIPESLENGCFEGTIIHHKDFAKWERGLEKVSDTHIIVIGGAKSAADVAYACAKRGHNVVWLIRESGSGPAAFVSPKGKMGYANSNELFYTRLTSLFLVSMFTQGTGYNFVLGWINKTTAGRYLLRRIWQNINAKAWKEADYDRADGKANGLYNLKPDTELFWQNDSTGINQRPDFFDTIARSVKVFRQDISHLSRDGVVLNMGETLKADTIICSTGWKVDHPYFDGCVAAKLGLPVVKDGLSTMQQAYLDTMDSDAERHIITDFPILDSEWARSNDKCNRPDQDRMTPFRLWKSIVPVQDPSILFVGRLMLGNHFRAAEVQALFACGVLDNTIKLPGVSVMERDVARSIAWCRRRYLRKGALGNWFYWDMVPYTDTLLKEMSLTSHRHTSWWKDLFRPCYARDLKGLIEEYRTKNEATMNAS